MKFGVGGRPPLAAQSLIFRWCHKRKFCDLPGVRTLAGHADTSKHGQVRFVISLAGKTGEMRFRLLRAIERGL